MILPTSLGVFVMMIFVLIAAGATVFAQAIPNTSPTATPHVIIVFVGNTSPIAGVDRVSIAGIVSYNAMSSSSISSKYTEQKLITVSWGDGTSSQSKITRISSAGEGKWGPLYHKYNSVTPSNSYAIVATCDVLSSSSNIVQINSEPYLINIQKGPSNSLREFMERESILVSNLLTMNHS
jgi:hypothetical protein